MKIIIIGTIASSFYGFRADLIKSLYNKGYVIYAFISEYKDADLEKINSLGAIPVIYELNRGGLNPLLDLIATYKLSQKIREIKPDIVFSYFSKPVIFGTLAAKLAAVPRRIGMLEGLGYTFTDQPNGISSKAKLIRNIQILMLNIVYIITRSDVLGGASVHLLDLAKGMIRQGHQVHILVGGEGAFTEELKKNNINFSSLKYLKREISIKDDLLGFWEIKKHLKQLKPDIVHCHSSKAGLLGRLAAKSLNLPVVFTAHGWAFTDGVSPRKQKIYATLERFMTKFSDHIITVSEYDRQHGFKHNVGTPELVQTIHNGVPDIKTSASEKSSSIVRLIMVARFEDPKDQYFLIQALSKLPAHLNWQIDFLGDGPNLQKCQELANLENLDSKIIFHGQSFKVKEFLNLADIFVLSSAFEGFGLVVAEAMACQTFVVATDCGGVKEVMGGYGLLVPPKAPEDLAQAIYKALLMSSEEQRFNNQKALEYVQQNFDLSKIVGKWIELYES